MQKRTEVVLLLRDGQRIEESVVEREGRAVHCPKRGDQIAL